MNIPLLPATIATLGEASTDAPAEAATTTAEAAFGDLFAALVGSPPPPAPSVVEQTDADDAPESDDETTPEAVAAAATFTVAPAPTVAATPTPGAPPVATAADDALPTESALPSGPDVAVMAATGPGPEPAPTESGGVGGDEAVTPPDLTTSDVTSAPVLLDAEAATPTPNSSPVAGGPTADGESPPPVAAPAATPTTPNPTPASPPDVGPETSPSPSVETPGPRTAETASASGPPPRAGTSLPPSAAAGVSTVDLPTGEGLPPGETSSPTRAPTPPPARTEGTVEPLGTAPVEPRIGSPAERADGPSIVSPAGLDRVVEAVRELAGSRPPRSIAVRLDDLGGVRVTVSLRADGIHLSVPTARADHQALLGDLTLALGRAGFDLAGSTWSDAERHRGAPPDPDDAEARGMTRPRRRRTAAPPDDAIRM